MSSLSLSIPLSSFPCFPFSLGVSPDPLILKIQYLTLSLPLPHPFFFPSLFPLFLSPRSNSLHNFYPLSNINISLPRSTRNNGSLYVHVYLGPKGKSPLRHSDIQDLSVVVAPLTRYAVPQSTVYSLLAGTDQAVRHMFII